MGLLPEQIQGLFSNSQDSGQSLTMPLFALAAGLGNASHQGLGLGEGIGIGGLSFGQTLEQQKATANALKRQQLQDQLEQSKFGLSQQQVDNEKAYRDASLGLQGRELDLKGQQIAQGGELPASIRLANEIAKARAAGDMQRVQDLQAAAKMSAFGSGGFTTADPNTPAPPAVHGEDYLKNLNPQMAAMVKLIATGNEKSSTILSRMSPADKASIMYHVQNYNPDYSANQFGAVKDFNTGKQGNQVRSMAVSDSHLQTLGGLVDALDNGDIQVLNSFKNAWETQTGAAAPTNFNAAKSLVADEVSKAIVGGVTALGDRKDVAHNINAASSPAQLKEVIQTYRDLMKGQLDGLQQQYERSTGRKDFGTFVKKDEQPATKVIRYDATGKRL